jgi:type II secretory pathway pseudopilin PulG
MRRARYWIVAGMGITASLAVTAWAATAQQANEARKARDQANAANEELVRAADRQRCPHRTRDAGVPVPMDDEANAHRAMIDYVFSIRSRHPYGREIIERGCAYLFK